MICDRCNTETGIYTTSYFNTDTICMDCKTKEREHPKFREAEAAEIAAVLSGDYNFPGIGKPADL